jgi:IclR family transcriptional regulator, acetate operon repressor
MRRNTPLAPPPVAGQLISTGRAAKRPVRLERGPHAFPTIKAVAILEAMGSARRPLSITELGVLLSIPKPTAHRILRMLEDEGLLQREPGDRRYVPGARLVTLGLDIVAAAMQRGPRHAILTALSAATGETCNFGVMVDSHVLYLNRVESAWPFGLRFEPGSRVPLHCTAMGKLFLSQLPAEKCAALLRAAPLYRYTENTIIEPTSFGPELDRIRATGVSTDNQEFLAGVICVAVSVASASGRPAAALAISAPTARMSLQDALRYVPKLRAAADRLSKTIMGAEQPAALVRRKPRGKAS